MIALDTNILLPAVESANPHHEAAVRFLAGLQDSEEVAVSEFILLELYGLLRNPTVLGRPLSAPRAAAVCEAFRQHPRWQLLGFPPDSRSFHDTLWPALRKESLARRRIYDLRAALSMIRQGVTDFATVNTRDFADVGFHRVWNPLAA